MRHLILPIFLAVSACQAHKTANVAPLPSQEDPESSANRSAADAALSERVADIARLTENFKRIGFGFDRADLDPDARRLLTENSAILRRHADLVVEVQGHADHYGSDEYNLALGEHRADAVFRYLKDLGVETTQLRTISFGEEKPLVDEGTREDESPNRRAEFVVKEGYGAASSTGG